MYDTDPELLRTRKKQRIDERRAASKLPLQTKFETLTSAPSRHEVAGYMPGRLEFETEFFNEADERVKDMVFDDDPYSEDPGEVELKLAVLDIYNHNLTKRAEKKRVIFEHGLLDYKKKQQWEKRWTKEERDIVNKTKPLARLQNSADYETLVEGLVAENKIRNRIFELQEYRRNGCITLDQGVKYDRDKATRVLPSCDTTNNSTLQCAIIQASSHPVYHPATRVQCNDRPPQQASPKTISVSLPIPHENQLPNSPRTIPASTRNNPVNPPIHSTYPTPPTCTSSRPLNRRYVPNSEFCRNLISLLRRLYSGSCSGQEGR